MFSVFAESVNLKKLDDMMILKYVEYINISILVCET